MTAIPCASVALKTMADGTLRISFDIEPRHAQDAFRLFAAPGTPAALAALQVGYAAQPAISKVETTEKPKGGALSKLAGMWCQESVFREWRVGLDRHSTCYTEEDARQFVLDICNIESRAQLDHNPAAAERFHALIRLPFQKYLQERAK